MHNPRTFTPTGSKFIDYHSPPLFAAQHNPFAMLNLQLGGDGGGGFAGVYGGEDRTGTGAVKWHGASIKLTAPSFSSRENTEHYFSPQFHKGEQTGT
ncbi:hypothetical protein JYG34_10325 [Pseudomonas entomophila]|uniref:hypothetical protein n=1 Tax=Pseudomonas entomophila TaxID=312306 RepID=UPI001BCAC691|nr:hypothetical protein [Pseudomonas entomophila]QVM93381.1 hypothetical protein JYG34_10325 [Pseudomonas entomophila]